MAAVPLTRLALAIFTLPSLVSLALLTSACGGGAAPNATQNRVFYQNGDTTAGGQAAPAIERDYPPLDTAEAAPMPEFVGISLFDGLMKFARPRAWVIRSASATPGARFVEYVSPHAYVFAVYELGESPDGTWHEIESGYEGQANKAGAKLVGQDVPMATANAQGRAYLVRKQVDAAKAPLVNFSNEYLLRGDHKVILVQVVHHEEHLAAIGDELRHVLESVELH